MAEQYIGNRHHLEVIVDLIAMLEVACEQAHWEKGKGEGKMSLHGKHTKTNMCVLNQDAKFPLADTH